MSRAEDVAAVVLAAGAATRFGSPKQNVLLPAVLESADAARVFADVVIVAGAYPIDVTLPPRARIVKCTDWQRGPGASLRCGLSSLAAETQVAAVLLADGPRLDPRAIDRMVHAWRQGQGSVLAASYGGERSHPVVLARSEWARIPEGGGRNLAARLIDCSDLREPGDIDTEEDLAVLGGN
jgi:CTP:molybdopterin cytidylyltransferase MocA